MTEHKVMPEQPAPVKPRKGSIFRTIKAVLWSFLGVRSHGGYEQDVAQLNPLHIVITGLVGVFVFVGGLILLATWVVGK